TIPRVIAAHEQVEVAVVVVVSPGGHDGVDWVHQACSARDVGEGAIAVVPQQRWPHGDVVPRAADDIDVFEAVVVVIGLYAVETAQLVAQSCLVGPVPKSSVPAIVIERQWNSWVPGGNDQVELTIVVEILQDGAAGLAEA